MALFLSWLAFGCAPLAVAALSHFFGAAESPHSVFGGFCSKSEELQ